MKRIRVSIGGMMALVALAAIDFVVIRAFQNVQTEAARIVLFGALPMADVLAVYLAIVISSLVRRGEVTLSRVTFLVFGGTAILVLLAVCNLAPSFFFMYYGNTVGLLFRSGQNPSTMSRFGLVAYGLIRLLLVWGALTPPILVPALVAGWMTRGYRLKVLEGPESQRDSRRDRPGT